MSVMSDNTPPGRNGSPLSSSAVKLPPERPSAATSTKPLSRGAASFPNRPPPSAPCISLTASSASTRSVCTTAASGAMSSVAWSSASFPSTVSHHPSRSPDYGTTFPLKMPPSCAPSTTAPPLADRTVAPSLSNPASLPANPAVASLPANPAVASLPANPAIPPSLANPAIASSSANPAIPPPLANPAIPPPLANPAVAPSLANPAVNNRHPTNAEVIQQLNSYLFQCQQYYNFHRQRLLQVMQQEEVFSRSPADRAALGAKGITLDMLIQHKLAAQRCLQQVQVQAGLAQDQIRMRQMSLPATGIGSPFPGHPATSALSQAMSSSQLPPSDFFSPPLSFLPSSLPMPSSNDSAQTTVSSYGRSASFMTSSSLSSPSTSSTGSSSGSTPSLGSLYNGASPPPALPFPASWSPDQMDCPTPFGGSAFFAHSLHSSFPGSSSLVDPLSPGVPFSPVSPCEVGFDAKLSAIGSERYVRPPPPGLTKPLTGSKLANGFSPRVSSPQNYSTSGKRPSWMSQSAMPTSSLSRLPLEGSSSKRGAKSWAKMSPWSQNSVFDSAVGPQTQSRDASLTNSRSKSSVPKKSTLSADAAPWPQPEAESAFGGIGMTWLLIENVPSEVGV